MARTTPLWLYLHFPDLYLHSLNAGPDQPLAIIDSSSQGVVQCNAQAQQAGVVRDMSLATAVSLCPTLQCWPMDADREQQLLEQKALWAYRYAAQVCLDPPQGIWLEVATMLRLFGGLESLWHRLLREAPEQWPLQLAAAPSAQAARLLAINGLGYPTTDCDGLRQQLHGLTLAQLQLDAARQLQLQRLNARTLGDLLRLPMAELALRYGHDLVDYLERIQGVRQQPMHWFEPPLVFQQDAYFIEEVEHCNGLLFPLKPLLAALSSFLHQRQLCCRHLILQLSHRDQPTTEWRLGFARGEHREQEWLTLVRYRLERYRLTAPVTSLRLRVEQFEPRYPQADQRWQKILGAAQAAEHSAGDGLLNRLQARLHHQQLYYLQGSADPRPEMAGQLMDCHQRPRPTSVRSGLKRPLWLLPQPIPCPEPSLEQLIERHPERISSGWWQTPQVRRDYYLCWHQGQVSWLFRDASQQWFLHGWFG